jgi:hypothetical protein
MLLSVMAGLVPAIHVFTGSVEDVDARDKPGHDEEEIDEQEILKAADG